MISYRFLTVALIGRQLSQSLDGRVVNMMCKLTLPSLLVENQIKKQKSKCRFLFKESSIKRANS